MDLLAPVRTAGAPPPSRRSPGRRPRPSASSTTRGPFFASIWRSRAVTSRKARHGHERHRDDSLPRVGAVNRVPLAKIDRAMSRFSGTARRRSPRRQSRDRHRRHLPGFRRAVAGARHRRHVRRPCTGLPVVAPAIDELAGQMAGRVRFAKFNVDENPATAARFNVRSIPTLLSRGRRGRCASSRSSHPRSRAGFARSLPDRERASSASPKCHVPVISRDLADDGEADARLTVAAPAAPARTQHDPRRHGGCRLRLRRDAGRRGDRGRRRRSCPRVQG